MRKHPPRRGKGMGAGAEAAPAITDMAAQIKSGPVINGFRDGRLDGHVGCIGAAIERKQAQAHECASAGSAVAIHWVDVFSGSMPAVSFVITAIMPTRCPQGNEAVRRRCRLPRSKSQIKRR